VKTCTKCARTLPRAGFYMDRSKRDGLQPHCRDCDNAQSLAWKHANREHVRAYSRRYRANRRRQEKPR
jgi:hypothetical protein